MISAGTRIFWEDVVVGEVLITPAMTMTRAHVNLFRGLTGEDPSEDPDAVPDLLPLCVSTGLGWRLDRPPLAVLAFMALDWNIRAPVRVGDTVHSRSCALAKRTLREGGIIVEDHEVVRQDGEVVQKGKFTFLVAKRPKEAAS